MKFVFFLFRRTEKIDSVMKGLMWQQRVNSNISCHQEMIALVSDANNTSTDTTNKNLACCCKQ